MPDEDHAASVAAFIAHETGGKNVRVTGLRRLTGGASRETWSLDVTLDRGDGAPEALPLIWQRDVRGAAKSLSRILEYKLMQAAFSEGIPAPEPMFFGDATVGAGESFFVRRVDGETLPKRLLRDGAYATARHALTPQLGALLARIHAIDPAKHGLADLPAPPPGASPAAYELERYEQVFRGIALEPHPAFELAFRWLRQHPVISAASTLPSGERVDAKRRPAHREEGEGPARALVHGDFRIGNVLFGPDGLRLMLDWELAHIGDPMEDLGFICVRSWRFGGEKPVGGIGDRAEFFAAYEAAGGATVDPEHVRFWEVFGNLRWGVICLSQARTYLDGHSNSVELAAIGRRTAETEWELLELVGSG